MSHMVRVAGTYRSVKTFVRVSGTYRCASRWVRVSGTYRQVSVCLSVTADSFLRIVNAPGPGCTACSSVTSLSTSPNVVVTGGSGSYTYSWARTSGASACGAFTISNAAIANPTWTATVCGTTCSETWQVTVTDTVGGATGTAGITVQLRQTNAC